MNTHSISTVHAHPFKNNAHSEDELEDPDFGPCPCLVFPLVWESFSHGIGCPSAGVSWARSHYSPAPMDTAPFGRFCSKRSSPITHVPDLCRYLNAVMC